ncbi:putative selenate ABC transporter substrate-binding protein [Dolosicoccus paucivorans]|uniref:Putative selenate ABC transporter substrate-binding protein n=1 Tax=Dolosicoccus paucivorans TaxID=84521 RepID=A0A2N6SQ15_9LACT|nr:putative selenate ABC transporter substrate-binding protein [Dolosicoccus paucivorans]PMB84555.1 putative selenate ABC transporter substrate-binding protein [Dolosicoccus paucivorans]PMC59150.1 putative selenate ABC transporter substrate-binding protein [Dolosicoccus paucivorans]
MKKLIRIMMILGLGFSVLSGLSLSAVAQDKPVLKISAIPDFDQTALTKGFGSFADYLAKELDMNVEYVPVTDYTAVVTGFDRGDIDLAWFGGLTTVQAQAINDKAEAIAQRPMDAEFKSHFIKRKDVAIDSLEDLKGHSFTFGSESSTSGHLMPRYFLEEAGINPETDFDGLPLYSGSHDKTMALVEAGTVDAGAVNQQYWQQALENGEVNTDLIESFYVTPDYYDYNWTVGDVDAKFGPGTKDKIKAAILKATPADSSVLELLSTDKFIETNNENYQKIEKVARDLGLVE